MRGGVAAQAAYLAAGGFDSWSVPKIAQFWFFHQYLEIKPIL
jgi:hypothetical protein